MSPYIFFNCLPDAPKLPSVSVSPSGEIVEGSSVNLTCSSDANPAANYTWYKDDEDSPEASGPIVIISDARSKHSGNYYCEVQNKRGRHNSTLSLTVLAGQFVCSPSSICLLLMFLDLNTITGGCRSPLLFLDAT